MEESGKVDEIIFANPFKLDKSLTKELGRKVICAWDGAKFNLEELLSPGRL
ncbi:hypothetical protein LR007_03945 [candidate division NPL-UPA2 bacterium]|nr:hypothetical protein [candidate division NPL-UPA2 bacterium]